MPCHLCCLFFCALTGSFHFAPNGFIQDGFKSSNLHFISYVGSSIETRELRSQSSGLRFNYIPSHIAFQLEELVPPPIQPLQGALETTIADPHRLHILARDSPPDPVAVCGS